MNFLEELAKEWYEYQGFWVRTNVQVNHQELDVVAYHGERKELVHIETGKDASSWRDFEQKAKKKFNFTEKQYEEVLHSRIAKVAKIYVAGWASNTPRVWKRQTGEIKVVFLTEFLLQVASELPETTVPERRWPLLHTIQWVRSAVGRSLKERSIEELLAGVTPSNLHEEVDWGPVKGGEAW